MRTDKSFDILGEKKRKTNRTISQLIPFAVSLRRAGVEQLGIGNMLFSIYSQTENV